MLDEADIAVKPRAPRHATRYWPTRGRLDPQVRIVRRYTVEPRIDGIRGWDGRSYAHGINGLKFQVRRIARIVSPWIWI